MSGAPSAGSANGGQRGAPPMGVYGVLHIIGGNDRGKQYELNKLITTVGRGADQELVLADIAVSRKHMKIYLQQNGYRIQDLGSGNGSLVNGKRLEESMLVDGDQIELGNTLLRFEHPPSRPAAEAPPAYPPPQPAYAPPAPPAAQPYPPMPPPQQPPMPAPYASAMGPAVAQPQPYMSSVAQPPVMAPAPVAPIAAAPLPSLGAAPAVAEPHGGGGFLGTERSRKIAFSSAGLGLLLGLGLLAFAINKGGRADPAADANAALEHYNKGTKGFVAEDYEAARKEFQEALALAPGSAELQQYLKACDVEEEAAKAIKKAKAEVENHRYSEALASFKQVDEKSVRYEDVQGQMRDVKLAAVSTALNEARSLSLSEGQRDRALAKIQEGLKVDPQNADLLALKDRVEGGSSVPKLPIVAKVDPPVKQPKPDKPPKERIARVEKPPKDKTPKTPVGPTPPVKGPDTPAGSVAGADLQSNKGALIAYRSRDFGGAVAAMQNFAKVNKGPAQAKAQGTARDIEEVRSLADKAAKLEATSPVQALASYNQAATADRRVSGGALSAYFNDKIKALQARTGGAVVKPPAQTPQTGRPPVTPVASDPRRDAQADGYLQQARAVMSKDPGKARTLCRQAMRLYQIDGKANTNHPKYLEAFRLLNNIKGPDEDE